MRVRILYFSGASRTTVKILLSLLVFITLSSGCGGGGEIEETFNSMNNQQNTIPLPPPPANVVYMLRDIDAQSSSKLVVVDTATKQTKTIADSALTLTFSAREDSDTIAYCDGAGYGETTSFEIHAIKKDGTGHVRLTNNSNLDCLPIIAADGNIYFRHDSEDADTDIYRVNADGTGMTNITDTTASTIGHFDIAPDTSYLVFSEKYTSTNNYLYLFNLITKTETLLVEHDVGDFVSFPFISPKGDQIIYISDCDERDRCKKVHVITLEGEEIAALTQTAYTYYPVFVWSSDGTEFAYSKDKNFWGSEICTYSLKNRKESCIVSDEDGKYTVADWSDDGNYILADYMDPTVANFKSNVFYFSRDGANRTQLTNCQGRQYIGGSMFIK